MLAHCSMVVLVLGALLFVLGTVLMRNAGRARRADSSWLRCTCSDLVPSAATCSVMSADESGMRGCAVKPEPHAFWLDPMALAS